MLLRGRQGLIYAECYGGNLSLNEPIPTETLTGTLAFDPTTNIVTGTGTNFIDECHLGQLILADTEVLAVDQVLDPLQFIATRTPLTSAIAATGYRLPRMFAINKQRGTLLSGNAIEFDQGTIIFGGSGTLRVDGSTLPTASGSWLANRIFKIAIYNPTTGLYDIYDLGMLAIGTLTATGVGGGTKNMPAGDYSIYVVPSKTQAGWNNPVEPRANVTITAGQKIRLNFSGLTPDTGAGQNAYRIYGAPVDATGSTTDFQNQGPWYYLETVTLDQLTTSGGTWDIEYLTAEINRGELLQFDNDEPLPAEFITGAPAGYPVYVSVQGKGTPSIKAGYAPGPSILPTRPSNIESSPLTGIVPLSPPEVIVGCASAAGRLYLMTPNTLQFAVFTANAAFPITARPFWQSGFKNTDSLVIVVDTIYGYTTNGMLRSIATGDEGAETADFARDVEELTQQWNPGLVMVGYDQINENVVFFHAADSLNDNGFWITKALAYSLRLQEWHPEIVISSPIRDMIVSGVATVNGNLEFLAGGRQDVGGVQIDTFRFDTESSEEIPYYIAWQYSDGGSENRDKIVRSLFATGKLTNGEASIHGSGSGQDVDVTALELSNSNSASGTIPLGTSTNVKQFERVQLCCPNLNLVTARISGTWDGVGMRDRVDEVVVEVAVQGVRR